MTAIEPKDNNTESSDSREKPLKPPATEENQKTRSAGDKGELSDEEYWEEMLFISLGPCGWNIGCGCG